ncbi:conserved hypothetical protein [Ricinus communis]|uniref:DUF4378 domain-containing protein n=1 Tax=Ricinus communis TaxID=3988 RepID=B9RDS5_RICCO|nr:conserved hypothetical protein [Ricinus communis]
MKLKINKACDLSSISALPPQSRLSTLPTGPQTSQLRSQQSQQSFSQGYSSQHGMFSQMSQTSFDEALTTDQRFNSQERENSLKKTSCFPSISYAREESQMPISRSSTNIMRKWNSASVPDHKCQINEELEHRIGMMETLLNKFGMILGSVQSDVMQVNKGTKEASLEMEGIRQKLVVLDTSLQLMIKGQEDTKFTLDGSLKSISERLSKDISQDRLQQIFLVLSAFPQQMEASLLKLQSDLSMTFTKELQAYGAQRGPLPRERATSRAKTAICKHASKGKHGAVDEDIHPSKELKDAIKILSSDEELSMKLLQGPKSLMVKYIENLWNAQVEKDEVSKPLVGSNLSEQEIRDLKQTDEVVHSKQRKFFRRKAKSLEKTPSNKATQASNKIVILKPGPALLEKPETEGSIGPAPESQPFIRYKGPDERVGSYFFLSEIKRKLKQAMGKEQPEIAPDSISKKFPNKHWARADTDRRYKENAGRNSPGKEHFFIEKIARPSGVKKGEKTDKSKVCETGVERETGNNSKQRLTNIYVEAKKHLSEMVTSGNGEGDFSSRQVPRTLGRILSLPEYNCSPFGSPGRDWGQSFVTAQMRFSANDKFQKQENNVSHLGRMTLNSESELCASDENTNGKAEASIDSNSSASNDIVQDIEVERISCFIGDGTTSEGDVEIIKADEIVVQGDVNILDSLSEPSNSCITRDDQTGGLSEVSDAKGYSDSLRVVKSLTDEEIQPLPSLLTTLSSSPVTKKENDQECSVEVSDRPSPVSVLEPLFTEEDISPASTRYQPAELPMPPLRIQFEEHGPSSTDLGTHLKACIQDKESVFEYIKAVLEASELNWDEFYIMSNSSDPLLDPSIYDEVGFYPNQLCYDRKLLFDCISEVLMEVYERYFGCPLGLSFGKPTVQPAPDMKYAIHAVWEGVYWYILPLPLPHTLEQIVKKDMAKTGSWMDLRCDSETMVIEIGDAIFKDLIGETVLSCVNEGPEVENHLLQVEPRDESSIEL